MRHYPAFMDLAGRRVLVLGTGEVAERKAGALARAGARVDHAERFTPDLLDGCTLAVGADAAEEHLAALSDAAQARGIPVNVVDRPELSSFITPAVVDRDPILVAVSSGGTAPVLARGVRARIEAMLPPTYGRLAALADRLKAEIRGRFPDMALRRRVLERMLSGPAAELAFAGDDDAALAEMRRELDAGTERTGFVSLVGAGPGAADLLTLRAHRLMVEADVIVHDRLVTDEVLDMARRDAERIYVGKSRADHALPQTDINALLVRLAREGKRVVRLKGGDPYVFGHGGEEAEALHAAGVSFAVVPGITAALACAAQARIPLTHKDAAGSLTFVTGHAKDGRLALDFHTLARSAEAGTVAVYMGAASLPLLRDGLLSAGLDPRTPAALIERGGTPAQRAVFGTLDELVAQAPGWSTGGPTLVLVGAAVDRAIPAQARPLPVPV